VNTVINLRVLAPRSYDELWLQAVNEGQMICVVLWGSFQVLLEE
jgi:hypothetical protein